MFESVSLRLINCLFVGIVFTYGCARQDSLSPEIREALIQPGHGLLGQDVDGISPEDDDAEQQPIIQVVEVSEKEWIDQAQLPWSYAEIHYVHGRRIGYSIMNVGQSETTDVNLLKIDRLDVIDRSPSGQPVPVRQVKYESYEKPNGELASFKFLSSIDGEIDLEIEGRIIFDQIDVTRKEKSGKPKRMQIPWEKGNWGPLGVQFVLMRNPMSPGEVREVSVYLPQLGQSVPVRLLAKSPEITSLAGQAAAELLPVDVLMGTPQSGSYSRVWVDQRGVIEKTTSLSGDSVIKTRVAPETVRRLADQSEFRRYREHHIPVLGHIESLSTSSPVTMAVQSIELDPFGLFLNNGRQRLRSVNAGSCQVTLHTLMNEENFKSEADYPGEADISPSMIIPAKHPLFTQLNERIFGAQMIEEGCTVEEIGEVLVNSLHQSWQPLPQGAEIRSTLVAARTNSGGFVEMASVLAALLRNRDIPARLVGGLLIDPNKSQAGFHVWNQAWNGQQWIELDAFMGTPVGNYHVSMVTTDASGENPYHLWLPKLKEIREILDLDVLTMSFDSN